MNRRGGRFFRGRGEKGRGRDGRDRVGSKSILTSRKKGLYAALGDNIFTYNKKGAADQLAIIFRQFVKHIGTVYGQENSNEINNRTAVIIVEPVYDQDLLDKQVIK